jgi:predicted ester cyclase
MTFEDNKAIIQQFVESFNQGDLDSIDKFMSPEFFNYLRAAGEGTQSEEFRQLAADLLSANPNLQLAVTDFADQGDTLTFNLTMTGTQTSDLWGLPGMNQQRTWTSTVTSRFTGGQFSVSWEDLSLPSMIGTLREMGFVPPPEDMDKPSKYPISFPEFLIKVVFNGQVADKECTHLDLIQVVEPTTDVCEQCVAQGDVWPALRMCLICGFVGCCDTSKNKHMKQHFQETGHPIFRTIRLQERWVWCYEDNAFISGKVLDKHG